MESTQPRKRQRAHSNDDLPTPPASDCEVETGTRTIATNVLATAASALSHVSHLYEADPVIRQNLADAIAAIVNAHRGGNKLIVCGVGKSAYIGMKLAATCKSLGIRASFMHACEAAHGDLGDLQANDVLLFVSYSGKTPELLNLLPHVLESTITIAISSQMRSSDCPLLAERRQGILLPAPIPVAEETTFGVSAPTTSTTVALAVTDMLALSVADEVHAEDKQLVFKRNHPGGAIGMTQLSTKKAKTSGVKLSVLELPSPTISAADA